MIEGPKARGVGGARSKIGERSQIGRGQTKTSRHGPRGKSQEAKGKIQRAVITRKRAGHVGQEAIGKEGIRRQEERGKGQEARGKV
jgi:hypothetical protein